MVDRLVTDDEWGRMEKRGANHYDVTVMLVLQDNVDEVGQVNS